MSNRNFFDFVKTADTRFALLVILTLIFAISANGQSQFWYAFTNQGMCKRWINLLTCEQVTGISSCTANPFTPGQLTSYYNLLYSDSAQQACEKYVKENMPNNNQVVTAKVQKENGVPNYLFYNCHLGNDQTAYTTVERRYFERQSCCNEQVVGVYGRFADDWVLKLVGGPNTPVVNIPKTTRLRGVDYAKGQKDIILEENIELNNNNGQIISDVFGIPGVNEYCNGILTKPTTVYSDCQAEIHHIIPRVDNQGCLCGRNSYKNAAVISAKLNKEIGRDCANPKLRAILDYYLGMTNANIAKIKAKQKVRAKRKIQRRSKVK